MRTRIISSFAVVLAGLIPTIVGGPVFAISLMLLSIAGFREYVAITTRFNGPAPMPLTAAGAAAIAAFGIAAFAGGEPLALFAAVSVATAAPLAISATSARGTFIGGSIAGIGGLYLGMPIFAAIVLRSTPGEVEAAWLHDLATRFSLGWTPFPRGLAWALIVMVATWIGDTAAFLVGRRLGGIKLAPRISPNKTIAGAVSGLVGSALVGAIGFQTFGMGSAWLGIASGALIGAAGQLGDLAESFLKRQAGVKDSGNVIPGHGGVLDRIDALLFAFPAGWLIATLIDGLAR